MNIQKPCPALIVLLTITCVFSAIAAGQSRLRQKAVGEESTGPMPKEVESLEPTPESETRELLNIPGNVQLDTADADSIAHAAALIQLLGGDASDASWWTGFEDEFRKQWNIPDNVGGHGKDFDLGEILADTAVIQGLIGDQADASSELWGDVAGLRKGDINPEDFLRKYLPDGGWDNQGQAGGSNENDGGSGLSGADDSGAGNEAGTANDAVIPGQGGGDQPGSGSSESGANSATGPEGGEGTTTGGDKIGEITVFDVEGDDSGGFGYSWAYEGNDGSQVHGRTDCDGQGNCVDTYYDDDGNVVARKEYASDKGAPSEGTTDVVAVDCSDETNSDEPQCVSANSDDSNMPDPEKAGCIAKGCDEFLKWVNAMGIRNAPFMLDPQSTLSDPGGDEFGTSTRSNESRNVRFLDALRERINPAVNPDPEGGDEESDIVAPVRGPPRTDVVGSLPDPEPNPIEGGESVSPQNPKPGPTEGQGSPRF